MTWITRMSYEDPFLPADDISVLSKPRLYPIEAETASLPARQYIIVQEFFRYRAEKMTYKKFETA